MKADRIAGLKMNAVKSRLNVIRMLRSSGSGHLGGAFSCIDIVTALYFYKMNIDGQNPMMAERDRFLLSAGHKSMAQYAVLAEKEFFPKSYLDTYGHLDSKLPGHPDMHKLPGIEANTGALGHGLSIACGMALGLKVNNSEAKVYVVMGDGELCEGSNWEAAALAAHHRLDNVVVVVDYNGLQISGKIEDVMKMTPIDEHFAAFGWSAKNINGNNMEEIVSVLDQLPFEKGKPSLIVAHTTKAKGLKIGEGKAAYHYWTPSFEELKTAEKELQDDLRQLKMKGGDIK